MTISNDPEAALKLALAEIGELTEQTRALNLRARDRLDDVRHLLVGRRVFAFGRGYQISQVYISSSNQIAGSGVRVNTAGKPGTRELDIGSIVNWTFL